MSIDFSNCSTLFEQAVIWLFGLSILVVIFSGAFLFGGEKPQGKKISWKRELLGPLHPLFSKDYLKEEAYIYIKPFYGSIAIIVICIVLIKSMNLCAVNT